MKPGRRALGIAESFTHGDNESTLAGAVVRADRVVDGIATDTCTVGGTDVTAAIVRLYRRLDREDIRYVILAGVALAWYNIVDLEAVAAETDRPVIAVTFEASQGLESALQAAFEGERLADRLKRYRQLPARQPLDLNDETVYARSVELDEPETQRVLAAYTPEGGRPEPVRVARLVARGAAQLRRS
ncbi:MAG: DUF99 family protein [Salinarchaeum sp.]